MAGKLFPLVCTSGLHAIGIQPLLDAIVSYVPSPGRTRVPGAGRRRTPSHGQGRTSGAVRRVRLEDDRRPVRRPHHDAARRHRHAEVGRHRAQPARARRSERLGHLLALQGKTQTHVPELKAGDLGAVAKLKDTHTNDVLADKTTQGQVRADQVPRAGAVLRHRAEEPRRRGQDQHRDAAAARGGSEHQLRARSADARTAAGRPGPAAHRGDGREAETPLRRRGEPQAAADSVPRDDHRRDRGARPPQEADRRARPVRRLQDQGGAAAARQRLPVRGRHLRRLDSAPVRPGRREGHPGRPHARLPRRLPDGRLQGDGLRRLVPRGRLERAVVQDGGHRSPSRTR